MNYYEMSQVSGVARNYVYGGQTRAPEGRGGGAEGAEWGGIWGGVSPLQPTTASEGAS